MSIPISRSLEDRAVEAWARLCARRNSIYDQPGPPDIVFDRRSDTRYVVLSNIRGVLAVYRETAAGLLRHVELGSLDKATRAQVEQVGA